MKTIRYKGYTGSISFSKEDNVYYGKLLDVPALVSFEGSTEEELLDDFHNAVNEYIESSENNDNFSYNHDESKTK